jgi:hypothetical protein
MDNHLDQMMGLLEMIVGSKKKPAAKGQKRKTGEFHSCWHPHSPLINAMTTDPSTAVPTPHCVLKPDVFPFTTQTQPQSTAPNITIHISNPSYDQLGPSSSEILVPVPLTLPNSSHDHCVSLPKYHEQPMTPVQLIRWDALLVKYGQACVTKHQWEWIHGDFLPFYTYQPVNTITDYWIKWTEGIGGYLSTRELTEVWGAKWRRNNGGQQMECGRRKRVIDLVIALSGRPNWNVKLAIQFLSEKYKKAYTPFPENSMIG